MFLRRFKDKSNQKFINHLLEEQKRIVPGGKVDSVGVLLNFNEFNQYDQFRKMLKEIGIKDNKVKFIAMIEDEKSRPNSWDDFFSPDDFGWKGKIKNMQLEEFINTSFDALICYYGGAVFELDFVSAMSKAKFKIGISDHDPRLFDLIIHLEPKYLSVFAREIEKYLTVLNKI